MSIDLIVYAVIAVAILVRLWMVLGRRNDNDGSRPNPFTPPAEDKPLAVRASAIPASPVLGAPLHSLQGKLDQIKAINPAFDEKQFLQGAKQAFSQILTAFANGNLVSCAKLLGPNVLPRFQVAIDARRAASQTMETRITRMKEVETVKATLDGALASIVVRFVSDQVNVLRDASGVAIGGEGKLEEITDIWTFAKDLKSNDPDWILVETKS